MIQLLYIRTNSIPKEMKKDASKKIQKLKLKQIKK